MTTERFITPQEVVNLVFDSRMEAALIKDHYIEIAQKAYLRPKITSDLYDYLVTNGLGTIAEEARLFKTALAYWVAYVASPFLASKASSSGFTKQANDDNIPLSETEMKCIRANYITMATAFLDEYIALIEAREETNYTNSDDTKDTTEIIGGIVLP